MSNSTKIKYQFVLPIVMTMKDIHTNYNDSKTSVVVPLALAELKHEIFNWY